MCTNEDTSGSARAKLRCLLPLFYLAIPNSWLFDIVHCQEKALIQIQTTHPI
jgi:hypothetical protein